MSVPYAAARLPGVMERIFPGLSSENHGKTDDNVNIAKLSPAGSYQALLGGSLGGDVIIRAGRIAAASVVKIWRDLPLRCFQISRSGV
ncbi:hypothetical protein NB714_004312 [Pantoea dispersa]|nr:hypothetical protein [Pantoea dispersa]MCW0328187.1 hypothetical protein [Pantoea dispersa]MCW0434614.1 hypothetical protein [Pantoea dispersa]